jgi:hypothetical protein
MKRTVLFCIVSSVILFIVSFFLSHTISDFFLSLFNGNNLQFAVYALNSYFIIALKVSLTIGTIPLLLLVAWIYGNITSFRKRSFSLLIVLVCIVLTIMLNVFRISGHEMLISPLGTPIPFPIEELYFEYAIISGVVSGSIISYFIFRNRKMQAETKAAIEEIGA